MSEKVLVAMSGGVDSAVALHLMKEQGFDCIGITMKLFENEDIGQAREKACCSLEDVNYAQSVCTASGIPFYVFNFSGEFKEKVIDRFVESYEQGDTPNPCIDCNRYLKFEHLYERGKQLDMDYVVTGHYARVEYNEVKNRYIMKKGVDPLKDQSYVLYAMTQEQLAHTQFPLGGLHKTQVRKIAEEQGFRNAKKRDSQDICFVQDGDYAKFIEQYNGKTYPEGDFVDKKGKVLGRHKGLIRYTIGQRKGLGLALPAPMYVCDKDLEQNTVILCSDEELFSKTLEAKDFNWIAYEKIQGPIRVKAKIRYKHPEQWATVTQSEDGKVQVVFDEPQRAITKGQAVVLYDEDIVVGGGTIC